MKQAAVGGGIAVIVLAAIALGVVLMSGGSESGDDESPTEPTVAEVEEAPTPEERVIPDDRPPAPAATKARVRTGRRGLKVNVAEKAPLDPDDPRVGLKDPEKWKEFRKERNRQWRDDQIALANNWIAANSLPAEQGQEVLEILGRGHDILEDTRSDIEARVINPTVGREEMDFAKEEVRIEILSLLGEESGNKFLDEIAKAQGGGF